MRATALSCSIFALLTPGILALPQINAGFTKGIIGVFDDPSCGVNQKDFSDTERTCHELPGQSMKIWWLKKGCGGAYWASETSIHDNWLRYVVVTIRERECKGMDPSIHYNWNECISTKNLLSWSIYCDPWESAVCCIRRKVGFETPCMHMALGVLCYGDGFSTLILADCGCWVFGLHHLGVSRSIPRVSLRAPFFISISIWVVVFNYGNAALL